MRITHAWRKARALAIAAALVCGAGVAGSLATPEAAHAMENGTTVPKGKYPFYTDVPGCGGALVAPTWVITAAHCARNQQIGSTQLAVNTYNYSERSSDVRSTVREIVFPQLPDIGSPDVALIRVDPVTSIRPIRLADSFIPEGSALTDIGMGVGSGGLLKAGVFTVANHNLGRSSVTIVSSSPDIHPNPGDSGSPYFVEVNGEPRLVGVHSMGWYSGGWVAGDVTDVASTAGLRDWFSRTTGNPVAPLNKTVTFRSETSGGYVSARLEVASMPVDAWVGRSRALAWEEFDLQYNADATVSIRSKANGRFISAAPGGERLVADRTWTLDWEKFIPLRNPNGSVSLRAVSNGKYVAVVTVGPDQIMTATGAAGARETQFWFSSL